ncbi:pectinesterase, partial [Colletotrichum higginsianum]
LPDPQRRRARPQERHRGADHLRHARHLHRAGPDPRLQRAPDHPGLHLRRPLLPEQHGHPDQQPLPHARQPHEQRPDRHPPPLGRQHQDLQPQHRKHLWPGRQERPGPRRQRPEDQPRLLRLQLHRLPGHHLRQRGPPDLRKVLHQRRRRLRLRPPRRRLVRDLRHPDHRQGLHHRQRPRRRQQHLLLRLQPRQRHRHQRPGLRHPRPPLEALLPRRLPEQLPRRRRQARRLVHLGQHPEHRRRLLQGVQEHRPGCRGRPRQLQLHPRRAHRARHRPGRRLQEGVVGGRELLV